MADETLRTNVSDEEVVTKYADMVYRLALTQTKNRQAAEDVFQEVFLRYLKKAQQFQSEEHRKAWLLRVTINCSKSIFLSPWYQRTVPLSEDLVFDQPEKSDIYFAVQQLPSKYKAVIHLFYYEDMSLKQIAACLNRSESAVKSQLSRARRLLKEKLKGGQFLV